MEGLQNPNPLHSLRPDQSVLINRVLEDLDHEKRALFDSLTPHEQTYVIDTLLNALNGNPEPFKTLWELDFVRKPVTIDEFIQGDEYFGPVCNPKNSTETLFPIWKKELDLLFNTENEINEVVVTGAIGTGKTTYAVVALAYKLYWLTCLRNPFQYFGMMQGTTSFVFGLFNATRELSTNVHIGKVLGAFNACRYFRWITQGTTDELERQTGVLKFPNSIKFAFGSRAIHALGQDIIGGLLDEMNFQTVTETSNQARELYRNTKRRITSRFPARLGRKSPGLLFLVSSRKGEDDFLDTHIREAAPTDKTVRIISYSMWEAKGHDSTLYPSGKWFRVLVGDDRFKSRILEENEADPEGYRTVKVPEEHRKDFEADPDGSLMDLAGVSIKGGGRPLINRDRLRECIEYDKEYLPREHPFRVDIVSLGLRNKNFIEDDFLWDKIVTCVDPYKKIYKPKVNPLAHRVIHLDPATSGDCLFGLCMGHVAGRTKIIRRDPSTMVEHRIVAPVIYIDLLLGISHPPGDEIDLSKVRSFIFFLRKLGFPIYKVTADQFQSADTLQIFKKQGYDTKRISLDLKPDNYGMTRQCIHEGRLLVYDYQPFVEEIIWLQVDPTDNNKVFALEKRHKDLSDSVAGVVASIMEDDKSEQSALEPIIATPDAVMRPKGAIDAEGDWMLEGIPGIEHITGIRNS